jgi:recombination protein RecR
MNVVPPAVEALIIELGKLPSVGRRTAERLAFHVLQGDEEKANALADAIRRVKIEVAECPRCHFLAQAGQCAICDDPSRDETILCVVERHLDVIAFEKAGGFRGRYHVMGGHLSPLRGVTADDLHIADLLDRVAAGAFSEIILATNPSVEGDATALYLTQTLTAGEARITRLGRGVSMGGSLEYTDPSTLRAALEGRQRI